MCHNKNTWRIDSGFFSTKKTNVGNSHVLLYKARRNIHDIMERTLDKNFNFRRNGMLPKLRSFQDQNNHNNHVRIGIPRTNDTHNEQSKNRASFIFELQIGNPTTRLISSLEWIKRS